jgi:ADP-heptose:LPS heptosyltransferase
MFTGCYIFDGSKSMKPLRRLTSEPKARRACVFFPGALGDFICLLPALQMLVRRACVDLFARSEFAAIAPARVTISSIERFEIRRLFAPGAVSNEQVRAFFKPYEDVYSWLGHDQPDFIRRLVAVSPGRVQVFPFQPAFVRVHQSEHYSICLDSIEARFAEPVISLRDEAIAWREDFWRRMGLGQRPVLIIAPGSGTREKNWPQEYFAAVAKWWQDRVSGAVILLIGPVEEERGGVEQLRNSCFVADHLDLAQAAALLARGDLYLGNDSGISHLAGAVGVRTIALFGPSGSQQWAPRGPKAVALRHAIACSPCAPETPKRCAHRLCLNGLFPTEVIEVLEELPEVATLTRGGVGITV